MARRGRRLLRRAVAKSISRPPPADPPPPAPLVARTYVGDAAGNFLRDAPPRGVGFLHAAPPPRYYGDPSAPAFETKEVEVRYDLFCQTWRYRRGDPRRRGPSAPSTLVLGMRLESAEETDAFASLILREFPEVEHVVFRRHGHAGRARVALYRDGYLPVESRVVSVVDQMLYYFCPVGVSARAETSCSCYEECRDVASMALECMRARGLDPLV